MTTSDRDTLEFSRNATIRVLMGVVLSVCFGSPEVRAAGAEAPAESRSSNTLYLCDPRDRSTNLEGVTVRDDDSIAIYTTSQNWGAVDEHVFSAELSIRDGKLVYTARVATVLVNQKQSGDIHLGDQVMGTFYDHQSNRKMDLTCEYMRQPK